MLEIVQHLISGTQQFIIDEAFMLMLLIITLIVTFHPRLRRRDNHPRFTWFLIASLGFFWFLFWHQLDGSNPLRLFHDTILIDAKALFFKQLFMAAGCVWLLHHWAMGYKVEGEFFIFFWALLVGLCLLVMTTNLLLLYVALELVSISSYILVALPQHKKSTEAGIKYLLFGAASSAAMLYGISWIYGLTGSLYFDTPEFGVALARSPAWVVQVVAFLSIGGLLFKLSAAPFHAWTPDIYEATPTPTVSFLSIAPKAAALVVLTRLIGKFTVDLAPILGAIAMLSWLIGNFSALWQTNVKRLMGYSSIAHAGFLLVGLMAVGKSGHQAAFFYVATYLFLTMGMFVLVDIIARRTGSFELADMRALGQQDKIIGVLAVVLIVGLVGLPPTVGFTAKLLVFSSLWETYQLKQAPLLLVVLIIGLLNTGVSIFYYLKIPYELVVRPKVAGQGTYRAKASFWSYVLAVFFAVAVLYLFINPTLLMQYISRI